MLLLGQSGRAEQFGSAYANKLLLVHQGIKHRLRSSFTATYF